MADLSVSVECGNCGGNVFMATCDNFRGALVRNADGTYERRCDRRARAASASELPYSTSASAHASSHAAR